MLLNVVTDLLAVAVVLGVMVLIHEWGHYVVAKLCGIRVETFSIGFGKRLWGFTRGGTDYRIAAIPLGGYVKMAGENPFETRSGAPDEFMSKPRWQRFLVAVAGPAVNIIFAFAVLTGLYMVSYPIPVAFDMPAVVAKVQPDSPAAQADIRPGDQIIKADGHDTPTWKEVLPQIQLDAGQPMTLVLKRGHETLTKTVTVKAVGPDRAGELGVQPRTTQVGNVEPGLPADKAGLKTGDDILAIDGKPVVSLEDVQEYLQQNKDKAVTLLVQRGDQQVTIANITPFLDTKTTKQPRYRLGYGIEKNIQLPFGQALARSYDTNKMYAGLILELVRRMVVHGSWKQVQQFEGPLRIAQISGEAARAPGWSPLLELMALISLNLGIFNLFPIPIMDGGVILLLAIEGAMRRDINARLKERIYQAAFVFLIVFAGIVIASDVLKTMASMGKP
jgi:regulator of sigma E protease